MDRTGTVSPIPALKRLIEAGSPDDLSARLAPGAVLWHNGDKREIDAAGGLNAVTGLHSVVDNLRLDVVQEEQLSCGVMVRFVVRGTVKSSGQPLEAHTCVVMHVADGQITRIDEYEDPTFAAQLGF